MHFTPILALLPGLALAIPAVILDTPVQQEPDAYATPTPVYWEGPGETIIATPIQYESGATPTPTPGSGSGSCYLGSASAYSESSSSGACEGAIPAPEADELVVAVNTKSFDTTRHCGASITAMNKWGESVELRIVDFCSECQDDDIQVSEAALKQLDSEEVYYCYN